MVAQSPGQDVMNKTLRVSPTFFERHGKDTGVSFTTLLGVVYDTLGGRSVNVHAPVFFFTIATAALERAGGVVSQGKGSHV